MSNYSYYSSDTTSSRVTTKIFRSHSPKLYNTDYTNGYAKDGYTEEVNRWWSEVCAECGISWGGHMNITPGNCPPDGHYAKVKNTSKIRDLKHHEEVKKELAKHKKWKEN